jgi:hypothetical protein
MQNRRDDPSYCFGGKPDRSLPASRASSARAHHPGEERRIMNRITSALCLTATLLWTIPASAAPDTIFGDFGELFRMYHMYSASDGKDRVEEITVPHATAPSMGEFVTLLDHEARKFSIIYEKDGGSGPPHTSNRRLLLLSLQGTIVVEIGDGKEYRVSPGVMMLSEDWTGKGHSGRCVAKDQKRCVMLVIEIGDVDTLPPLRN